ncbi:Putative serine/threonine-protein kinase, active [Septoria linicola]|uniref:non-specific serine/threonine protein kinase n=1 Tax=Septoria linicola TaxID=215465 RepID=A0A9Q9AMB1_9PEZI|nr:Putative serine/threonine-protein kinase, active [Septoria linicola]
MVPTLSSKQLYFRHRRARLARVTPGQHWSAFTGTVENEWRALTPGQRAAEGRRIRAAVRTGQTFGNIPDRPGLLAVAAAPPPVPGPAPQNIAVNLPQTIADFTPQEPPAGILGLQLPQVVVDFEPQSPPSIRPDPQTVTTEPVRAPIGDGGTIPRPGAKSPAWREPNDSERSIAGSVREVVSGVMNAFRVDRDTRKQLRKKTAEINPPDFKGVIWKHARYLGGGGFGHTNLYLGTDREDTINNRLVVKHCWASHRNWGSLAFWHGPRDSRLPMEIKAMQRLDDGMGDQNVVRYRWHVMHPNDMAYTIYMHFCGHGTLYDLIQRYQSRDDLFDIPQPALWAIFDALTQACLLMERGTPDLAQQPIVEWEQIVHKDIKPANIFLDEPSTAWASGIYPNAVLGDFGLCFLTHEDKDKLGPLAYNTGSGSKGYIAPEAVPLISDKTFSSRPLGKLLSWTNVYQIGVVMQRLITIDARPNRPDHADVEDTAYEWFPATFKAAKPELKDLCDLIEQCGLRVNGLSYVEDEYKLEMVYGETPLSSQQEDEPAA